MTEAYDLIVNGSLLGNIGVGGRDVSLRLIIIVVADKILYRILREEALEFLVQLGC